MSKAYCAVRITEEHQHFLRILFKDGGLGSSDPLVVYRSTRLLFGLRPAQIIFSLARNIAFQSTLSPELTKQVSQASYTDNLHLCSTTVTEGTEKARQVSGALEQMGFKLKTGWSVSGIPSEDPETSLLGLKYDQVGDILKVTPCFKSA